MIGRNLARRLCWSRAIALVLWAPPVLAQSSTADEQPARASAAANPINPFFFIDRNGPGFVGWINYSRIVSDKPVPPVATATADRPTMQNGRLQIRLGLEIPGARELGLGPAFLRFLPWKYLGFDFCF